MEESSFPLDVKRRPPGPLQRLVTWPAGWPRQQMLPDPECLDYAMGDRLRALSNEKRHADMYLSHMLLRAPEGQPRENLLARLDPLHAHVLVRRVPVLVVVEELRTVARGGRRAPPAGLVREEPDFGFDVGHCCPRAGLRVRVQRRRA